MLAAKLIRVIDEAVSARKGRNIFEFSNHNLTVSGYREDVVFVWNRDILHIVLEYVGPTRVGLDVFNGRYQVLRATKRESFRATRVL